MFTKVASTLQSWAARRKALLAAVVRIVAKPALAYACADPEVANTYGEVLGQGLAEALDLAMGSKKPSTEMSADEAGFRHRLEEMACLASSLIDKLEQQPELAKLPADLAAIEDHVRGLLVKHNGLRVELTGITREMRVQTLAIPRIEARLEHLNHAVLNLHEHLEKFKQRFIESPMFEDWQEWRRSDPEAIKLLNEADAHFLAGRRPQGIECLKKLFAMRGVGNATLAMHLGLHQLGSNDIPGARGTMAQIGGDTAILEHLRAGRITQAPHGTKAWPSLPRGFEIAFKYRIEEEVGRGGMASVYRAVGIDDFNEGQSFAIKVPAPGLLQTKELIDRFGREVRLARELSDGSPTQIVLTVGYEKFHSPHDGQPLYALVMEYIDGENLGAFLERRKAANKPLNRKEIIDILTPICQAMTLAHTRKHPKEPIIHRDGKPNNVMMTKEGLAKLMDFGIARTLEAADELTRPGQVFGTPEYMPPEMRLPKPMVDVRTDVYLLGCLLQEMMTFHPCGLVEERADLPPGWADLVGDATCRLRARRPESAAAFLDRLMKAPRSLDQKAKENQNERERIAAEARSYLQIGDHEHGLETLRSLEEHRRPDGLEKQLERVSVLLPRVEQLLDADKVQGWLRPTVEELADLCTLRNDLQRLLQRPELKPLAPGTILRNSIGMEFAWIPPTAWYETQFKRPYLMGSPNGVGADDERPQHRVVLTRGFWMAVTPTTQAQWKRVMNGHDPSHFKGDTRPVEQVNWEECRDFCRRLQSLDAQHWGGFAPSYDLPTEAEWEYACRAGTTTLYYFGDSESQLGEYAWYGNTSGNCGGQTQPVGGRKPNAWNLRDMLGNVWEWCLDTKETYKVEVMTDPCIGDKKDINSRVFRGGSWNDAPVYCRAARRGSYAPGVRNLSLGFRPCFRLD